MSCATCNPNGNTVDANCQCVPSPSGAALCDPRYANLPRAKKIRLIGSSGECLANFPEGQCGLVFFDGSGESEITSAPAQDLPSLVQYLTDLGSPDGLARQNGQLIEGIPANFDYLMVLEGTGDGCDRPAWKKWRGPANSVGYVFWNGTEFEFGGVNANGVVTSAVLDKLGEGYLPAYPSTIDPTTTGDKTQGFLCPTNEDIYKVGSDGVAKQINPAAVKGFVYYGEASACDGSVVPQVAQLCDITDPPCEDKPEPTQLLGCADDGDPASTGVTGSLPQGFCNKVVVSDGAGAPWGNASIGATFSPGNYGTLRQDLSASGSFSVTISDVSMSAAAGYTLPTGVTHAIVHVRAVLRKTISERTNLVVTVGGVGVVEASAYSWDGATEDEDIQTATAIVPVNGSGGIAIDVNHSNVSDSDYDVIVNLAGVLACAEEE